MSKSFHIGDILSITTGRLVSPRHIEGVYDILNYLTGDNLYTHQLGRASEECKPWLLRWHPELADAEATMANLDKWVKKAPTCPGEGCKMWLAELRMMFPTIQEHYDLEPIPKDDHEVKDPVQELVEMRGTDEGMIVVDPDGRIS